MYLSSILAFRKKLKIISYFQWVLHNFFMFYPKNPERPNRQSANMAHFVAFLWAFRKIYPCKIPRGGIWQLKVKLFTLHQPPLSVPSLRWHQSAALSSLLPEFKYSTVKHGGKIKLYFYIIHERLCLKNLRMSNYCWWIYFCGEQFSWNWTKMTYSWGLKFLAIIFSFIIYTENRYFVGTGIRQLDPPRTPWNLVFHEHSGSIPRNACIACET